MAETQDLRVIAQIGQAYVGICDQFLAEQLGRPYTLPELTQFAETAVATLLASAYTNFREVLGKEASEAWLKKTLAVGASSCRLLGAEALLKFEVHIKDMPNKLAKQRQEMQAQPQAPLEPTPAMKCTCPLEADGSCTACIGGLSEAFNRTFQFMQNMADHAKKNENMCIPCRSTQTDRALVTIVPAALAIVPADDQQEAGQQQVLGLLHQIAGGNGATAIPLTEKAFQEAIKK